MITCDKCNGQCCRDVAVDMDEPKTLEEWEYIRWLVAHENVSVYVDEEDDWLVEFVTPCLMLVNNKCKIYNDRPKICREHPLSDCVMNGDPGGEKLRFDTLEQVEKYIEEVVKPKLNQD